MDSPIARPRKLEISQLQEEEFIALLKRYTPSLTLLKLMVYKWAHQRVAEGIPRLGVCIFLLGIVRRLAELGSQANSMSDLYKWRTMGEPVVDLLREVEAQISGVMSERNVQARRFEHSGRTDEAVALWEANVADGFQGAEPYESLRVVYTTRKDYANAIRICEAAVRCRVPFDRSRLQRGRYSSLR
jgi:hypothetical protein